MHVRLRNRMMLGDTLMMTPLVRDLKRARPDWRLSVETSWPAIWENSPHLSPDEPWPPKADDAEYMRVCVGPGIVTQRSTGTGEHFCAAFRISWQAKTNILIKPGPLKPELFLTDEERARRPIVGPYWVVCTDCSDMNAKRWHEGRWQAVVDATPRLRWVQVGRARENRHRLRGRNVTDMVGKTDDVRSLFSIMANAEGFLGLVSGPHHVSAAFEKPAVIVAGAREPERFEAYPWQRFLSNVGALPCAPTKPCWACRFHPTGDACKRPLGHRVAGVARCLDMITVEQVVAAIDSYYDGGRLPAPEPKPAAVVLPGDPARAPLLRVVSNGRMYGGAERSVVEIARMAVADGWRVELATRHDALCEPMRQALPPEVERTKAISAPCDVLLLYASDMVYDLGKPEFAVFGRLQAGRRVMAMTYKIGNAPKASWARGWDRYLFLSSSMAAAWPEEPKTVLPPPVDLSAFYDAGPERDPSEVRVVRHSSQGDAKWPRSTADLVARARAASFVFMPGPSWLNGDDTRVVCLRENEMPPADLMERGNLFVYLLPAKYTDQGPRVVMEAMAAGLPVLAERGKGGAEDRVVDGETGWLVDADDHDRAVVIVNEMDMARLYAMGAAARERARKEFRRERWWETIKGDGR